jgi:threonine dehydrogenase-like Zn-dependent dehydrogenase
MRAALIKGEGRLEWDEFPDPVPGRGAVTVAVRYCGICGSDVHAFAHGGPYPPQLCGHEWTGTIEAVGAGVQELAEGDRVVVAVPHPCGTCPPCRAGYVGSCDGITRSLWADSEGSPHGAYASHLAASADRLLATPAALSDEAAALVEPATVALHGVRRCGIRLGDTVVVQGLGPIGAFALQWVRRHGAGRVIAIEPNATRRTLGQVLGADVVIDPSETAAVLELTGGLGADVVVECAGIPSTIQSAIDLARRGGQVMLIGLSDRPATVNPGVWLAKEVTVRASIAYIRPEFSITIDAMAAGELATAPIHSGTVGPAGLGDAFARLAAGAPEESKILFDPAG